MGTASAEANPGDMRDIEPKIVLSLDFFNHAQK